MNSIGVPSEWVEMIDPMVPVVLQLVMESWAEMPAFRPDERENDITVALCRALKRNRSARKLPFTIDTQQVELEPAPGEKIGILDISFRPLIPTEDIYFCLEGKRLNVVADDEPPRAYASEYVTKGMMRFITGQYAKEVLHGGMAGYVLDGNISSAIANVESNVQRHHVALCMKPPGELKSSSSLEAVESARESAHGRTCKAGVFRIHHLFLARRQ